MTRSKEVELIARMICLWVLDKNPDGESITMIGPNWKSEQPAAERIWQALERCRDRENNGIPDPIMIVQQHGDLV